MENSMGLLKIYVHRGVNLAIRDARSSDPYVRIKMGNQKLKTRVVKHNDNPVWNEELTLSISDPNLPIKLSVFDKDTFTRDDKMGDAEFYITPFVEALNLGSQGLPNETIIRKLQPSLENCLAEESCIIWKNGKLVQNLLLRLQNVESGEIEIHMEWIDIPSSRGL